MSNTNNCVFINCPYDAKYCILLQSMMFTIIVLGFQPRIAKETNDGGTTRLEKINTIINESQYSIHDLSRIRSSKPNEYYRMNMPFELGIDYGCRKYSQTIQHSNKKFLILGAEEHEYIKALSDISGIDIEYHHDKPICMVESVRNWFVINTELKNAPSPKELWYMWTDFCYFYNLNMRTKGYSTNRMYSIPVKEQIDIIKEFLN